MGKQLLVLTEEVEERLNQEPRGYKSALVDALLAQHYGIDLPEGEPHLDKRHEILSGLEYDTDDEVDDDTVHIQPMPEGKPLDGVQSPERELDTAPSVSITMMGKPAEQTPEGELVFAEEKEMCDIHGREKIAGICIDCI